MTESDIAYIAGLFDCNGSIYYKQIIKKRGKDKKAYPTWDIRMEINMTERSIITWVYEVLGVGTFSVKKPGKGRLGRKMQYRWRCGFRDAYYVCCLLFPYAHVKLPKIQQIISHYAKKKLQENNVVDFEHYKTWIKAK